MSPSQFALAVVVGLGLLGAIGAGIKAILDRRGLSAKADADEASATSVLTAAARELVDPLRKELALERTEHAKEIAELRRQVKAVLGDLAECRDEARQLREELTKARKENDRLRHRVVELEVFHGDAS